MDIILANSTDEMTTTFTNEKHLQETLVAHVHQFSATGGTLFFRREVPVGGIIPDLVCIAFPHYVPQVNFSRWSMIHAYLLWNLRCRSPLQATTLARRLFTRQRRISIALKDLYRDGAVYQNPSGSYSLAENLAKAKSEVIAIEAKIENWRGALRQASAYQRFADRVIVAMEKHRCPQKIDLEPFRTAGIGLCQVSTKTITNIVRSKHKSAKSPDREYLAAAPLLARPSTYWRHIEL